MRKGCEQLQKNVFDYIPLTFVVGFSRKQSASQFEEFGWCFSLIDKYHRKGKNLSEINQAIKKYPHLNESRIYRKRALTESMFAGENLWVLKPTSENCGRGVHVFHTIAQLFKLINEQLESKNKPKQLQPKEVAALTA